MVIIYSGSILVEKDSHMPMILLTLIDDKFKETNRNSKDLLMCCGEIISSVVVANALYNEGMGKH